MGAALRGLLVAVLLLSCARVASAQGHESRVALVIGNAAYKHGMPLRNPVRDADAMAVALQEFGFEVVKATDADRGGMARALGQFASKLKSDGVGLFFYAGHGIQVSGANYLIPVDAQIVEEHDAGLMGIDVQQVLRVMESRGSRFNMVFLDACRDNPFERGFRSAGSRGLAAIDAPRGTLLAYATAPGRTAADGDGVNGLFTAELLKAMSEPGISVDSVLKRAGAGVEQASGNKQVPWVNSSYRGNFYFIGPTTVNVAPPPSAPAAPAASASVAREVQEQAAWDAVKGSNSATTFEAFLKRFPDGVYADIARARADELKPGKPRQEAATTPPPVRAVPSVSPTDQRRADQAARDCAVEAQHRSADGTQPTEITFVNETGQPIRTYWLDHRGARKFYMEVPPGRHYAQPTYVSHPWVVTNAAERCLGVYLPDQAPLSIVVR